MARRAGADKAVQHQGLYGSASSHRERRGEGLTAEIDSIFYDDKSHVLFASFKYVGSDYKADMARMAENPRVREWWRMTDAWQESLVPGAVSSEAGEPSWWKPVEEVFYMP